jgi:hypothetical protein
MLGDPATDQEFKEAINDVIRFSATLDPSDETTIEISPASLGNATVGTYGGEGRELNPVTGLPYEENVVVLGDYGRVIAEFWADGPASETPPGHWDSIANTVSDELAALGPLRIGGEGAEVDRLEWDTKLYLALNGAAHDAAVAASRSRRVQLASGTRHWRIMSARSQCSRGAVLRMIRRPT